MQQAAADKAHAELMKELGQQNQAYDELVAYLDQHDEYLKAREARAGAAIMRMVAVEGV